MKAKTGSIQDQISVGYLPDVRRAMSDPVFWSGRGDDSDRLLAGREEIRKINQAIAAAEGTDVRDLSTWSEDRYDGIERNAVLRKRALKDAVCCFEQGAFYFHGKELGREESMEKLYGPMIDNCSDPDAGRSMPVGYAICTNRTNLMLFPSDTPLLDDREDPDFDLAYLTAVFLGEPLIIRGKSADGRYLDACTSYYDSGWIPVQDVAFCKDRASWLDAWDYDEDETLVVYDDKIITEDSNFAPETANRRLTMGTRLRMADRTAWEGKVSNRCAYNNYVVWFPVRLSEGSLENRPALISEHCRVSRGYLPLTRANLAKVIFNQLGNTYGWGGMLESQDCSGYVQAVYRCFGIRLARDSGCQAVQPVKKYDLRGKTDEEKAMIIKQLPLGSELLFQGHVMLYLGNEGDKLYVISAVSRLYIDGRHYKVRGTVINTLDVTKKDGSSWLSLLHTAEIPYCQEESRDAEAFLPAEVFLPSHSRKSSHSPGVNPDSASFEGIFFTRSPDWVGRLKAAGATRQLFVVAGIGKTTAWISMHELNGEGSWRQIFSTPGFIGRQGLGKEREGDEKTPVGTYHFNCAFGIADDPGCSLPYHKVGEDDYWSGDQRKDFHYNEMVNIRELPGLNTHDSEHLIDYKEQYQYCMNISWNEKGEEGKGSAIFLHCLGPDMPYTGGCIAIPKDKVVIALRHVREDCIVVIDDLEKLV